MKKTPLRTCFVTRNKFPKGSLLRIVKNQNNEDYKVHCSMEGHVNQAFARYITSSPYGFSEQGLENKLKLLVYHANKHELTIEDYYNLKYGNNNYVDINMKVKKICNSNNNNEYIASNSNNILKWSIGTPLFDHFFNS